MTELMEVRQLLTTFFDDLSATNGGTYSVSGTTWESAVFTTDSSTYNNLTATLLMSQTTAGSLVLDLYSDGSLYPGSLLGTFTNPASISSSLTATDFTLSGVTLAASTNYWLVLHASSGSYNWGWTNDFTIMSDWAESTDSGATWFSDNAFPFQYKVVGTTGTTPSVSIADVSISEGNSGSSTLTFTATLSAASASTVTVAYATANGTATAGTDYTSTSGTLTFLAGATSRTVSVTIAGDTTVESDETLFVNLSSAVNATIADSQAIGTITNDDSTLPTLSIGDVSLPEGNLGTKSATFTVSLSAASTSTVTVAYATANGTSAAGSDYTSTSGTLTFSAGTTSQSVTVTITGDTNVESDETFVVNLSSAVNATISDSQATGTITNDDSVPPTLTGPTATTESPAPTITWTAVTGATSYRVWLSNLSTGTSPLIDATVTTTSFTPNMSLGIGVYRVWVRAVFSDGSQTDWSDYRDFQVNTKPTVVSLTSTTLTGLPTYTWNALAGAVKYDVWVNNKSTGISQVLRDQNVTSTSYTPSSALPLGQYIFWVRGIDANNVAGNWTAGSFTSVMTYPTLTGPELVTFDTTPTFAWTAVDGAVRYDLFVSAAGSSSSTIRNSTLTTTTYTSTTVLANGTWNVWVRAVAASNFYGNWSFVRSIKIGGSPTVTSPTSTTSDTTPEFTWTVVGDTASYEIWINRIDVPTAPYLNVSSITTNSYTPTSAMPTGTYRVWVRAVSSTGTLSGWSAGVTFQIA